MLLSTVSSGRLIAMDMLELLSMIEINSARRTYYSILCHTLSYIYMYNQTRSQCNVLPEAKRTLAPPYVSH